MTTPPLTTGAPPPGAPDLVTTAPQAPIRGRSAEVPPARAAGGGPSRLRALDGLRLLAALMVAAYHFGGRNGEISQAWGGSPAHQFPTAAPLFAYGCLGVQIFFVISGFVICLSGWGRTLRAFTASRVSRLYPAYWAAILLVTAVFALPWVAYKALPPSEVLTNLTMLQQPLGVDRVLGVCWTLWAEMRFYALFALCVVLPGATRGRVVLFCAGWTLAAALAQAAHQPFLDTVLMPEYAPFFIGGVGLYLLHRYGARDPIAWAIVLVSWLIGQHYAVAGLWHAPSADAFSYRSTAGIIAVVTLGFALVAAVALGKLRWANWRWLTVAGALTYPFYLVHEHLGWVVVRALHHGIGLPSYATLLLTVALMLLLAWVLHRFVERPLTPLLRRSIDPRR
ncbi:Peptidoglycan/LPS O-acetylase OafA/YrhL, contains acyltransferase and SGNH-hydrolase domains [Streptomyces sp. 2224.1]|uniref:acyltransferase family protein n=1 Tax=unclassified Streptomyces TaxID=2593676 RepID=UPI00088E39E7|nr:MULTISPECIES: acyltransferase [unclassified Streptomyces]PBC84659.1 peptidoglycan/LPS O-acetylase OafA/YrhL [Streptomyces sp. 2321.6]SDR28443.1 Peptidoglycan/LPS O-acetylase OafA/YrhL, contains acyltransferase and SGNH-hydrolase domains [Streptomyces sp. KS_16]SEB66127.1 Peptidoglycan/LPS O-acetylase OafA/YrhL, contains acyltransferase and SGNH-hydrolase domains [Streptomyces sp. 2224.1]SED39579.1 Peptidoglycan/LPS O-acetylase OafA/YrhL, contains acyltransferase and SGNH-hydrolase domains [S